MAEASIPYMHITTGQILYKVEVALGHGKYVQTSYPSEWFAGHPNVKPIINVPKCTLNLNEIRSVIYSGIKKGNLEIHQVLHYFRRLSETLKETCKTTWESFGIVINPGRCDCYISDLVYFKESEAEHQIDKLTSTATAEDDNWMMIYLLALYRLNSATNTQYLETLTKMINAKIAKVGGKLSEPVDGILSKYAFVPDDEYAKFVCIYDMFYSKFSRSIHANVRVSTNTSRFKDCGILKSLEFIKKSVGWTLVDLKQWIWKTNLRDELNKVTKDGEEIDKIDSYSPYMTDLQLVEKSPYANSVNPDLHYWIHVIGASKGLERSKNSRLYTDIISPDIKGNAIITAYVKSQRIPCTADGKKLDLLQEAAETVLAKSWFTYIQAHHGKIPKKILLAVSSVWEQFRGMRKGTIGEHLLSMAVQKNWHFIQYDETNYNL